MLQITTDGPIYEYIDVEELWDPSYFNQTVWVDLDKKPLHKYLYYPAVYEGELIYVPYSLYPQEDSFAFLKTMNSQAQKSKFKWLYIGLSILMAIACFYVVYVKGFNPIYVGLTVMWALIGVYCIQYYRK